MKRMTSCFFLLAALVFAHPPVVPQQSAKPVGPYSPGMDTADFLYLSGQGVRDADGKMSAGVTDQARRCLTNIKDILEAGGLTLGHVVAVQVYLADLSMLSEVEKIYSEFFPQSAPARVVVGTVRMPTGTPIEMTAVAVKDISKKRVTPEGVWAGSRLYLNGIGATSVAEAQGLLNAALHKAGLSAKALVFLNTYTTGKATGAEGPVLALPGGAAVALSAIASKTAGKPAADGCREDGRTLYCEARAASASGSIADQTREVFTNVKARLESHGFHLDDIAATNVWLNDLDEFQAMNAVYASFFTTAFPTRTTIQPAPTQPGAPGIRLSIVAVK
jgi:2-iminobutanoate/2-iminopropanoate deaminase